jgi:hypothetical protein
MTKKPCKFYIPFDKVVPFTFPGDKNCEWFAPGIFEGVRCACMEKQSQYFKTFCPWTGRPDKEKP